jgi:hypothetical protein
MESGSFPFDTLRVRMTSVVWVLRCSEDGKCSRRMTSVGLMARFLRIED